MLGQIFYIHTIMNFYLQALNVKNNFMSLNNSHILLEKSDSYIGINTSKQMIWW